jgi:hypothetical protein
VSAVTFLIQSDLARALGVRPERVSIVAIRPLEVDEAITDHENSEALSSGMSQVLVELLPNPVDAAAAPTAQFEAARLCQYVIATEEQRQVRLSRPAGGRSKIKVLHADGEEEQGEHAFDLAAVVDRYSFLSFCFLFF